MDLANPVHTYILGALTGLLVGVTFAVTFMG